MRVKPRTVPGRRRNQQAEFTVVFKQNVCEKQAFTVRKGNFSEPSMLMDPLIQVKVTDVRRPSGSIPESSPRHAFMLLL